MTIGESLNEPSASVIAARVYLNIYSRVAIDYYFAPAFAGLVSGVKTFA